MSAVDTIDAGVRGTEEMMPPCLIYLRGISLTARSTQCCLYPKFSSWCASSATASVACSVPTRIPAGVKEMGRG